MKLRAALMVAMLAACSPDSGRNPGSALPTPAATGSHDETGLEAPADPEEPAGDARPLSLKAAVIGASGKVLGSATLEAADPVGVRIHLDVASLTPGLHAVGLHSRAICDPPGFFSAGGHFDPVNSRHGKPDADADPADPDHHAGDMLNQRADAAGLLNTTIVNRSVSLASGYNRLLDQDGSALVIYAWPDDFDTQPSGRAGPRVACAEISRQAAQI